MNVIKWIYGFCVALLGVAITVATATFIIIFGSLYRLLIHWWAKRWFDTPFAYMSIIFHTFVTLTFWCGLMAVKLKNVGPVLAKHEDRSIILIGGNHQPLLLMFPYYYLVCQDLCTLILVTVKKTGRYFLDFVIILIATALKAMGCVALLARGNGEDRERSLDSLVEIIHANANLRRGLTLHMDMSRATPKKINNDRIRFSKMLRDKYNIVDDLSWLTGTLFPRVHGFARSIETLPQDARVVFMFMVPSKPIWSVLDLHKLLGLTVRYWCEEYDIKELKQGPGEEHHAWMERLTVLLMDRWRRLNMRQQNYQNV